METISHSGHTLTGRLPGSFATRRPASRSRAWRLPATFSPGRRLAGIRDVVSQTDAQGRYRLVGMPKGKGNEIMAFPNDDQPYLIRSMTVPDDPGVGPVTVDFELHRGIWIEGRVIDKATGKPAIARLHYWPFRNNPFTRGLPEFDGLNVDGDQLRYATRADGSFRLVGLPGRAIVGAEAVAASYKLGVGADKIKGVEKNGYFPTYFNPIAPMLKWPNALQEIDPSKDATTVRCDFALERGDSIRVTLIDRESKPVTGCRVTGRANGNYAPVPQATFDLENFSLNETRPILIEHKVARDRQVPLAQIRREDTADDDDHPRAVRDARGPDSGRRRRPLGRDPSVGLSLPRRRFLAATYCRRLQARWHV